MLPNKDGDLNVASSTKYDLALIEIKSIITTNMNKIINNAMTLSYCKNLRYVEI